MIKKEEPDFLEQALATHYSAINTGRTAASENYSSARTKVPGIN